MKKSLLIGSAINMIFLGLSGAASANFIGSYSITEYEDANLQDGINLPLNTYNPTITITGTSDLQILNVDYGGGLFAADHSLITPNRLEHQRNVYLAELDANIVDSLYVSNGSHMAWAMVTQETYNLLDIAISVATWQRDTANGIPFSNLWDITFYNDSNLADTSVGFQEYHTLSTVADGAPGTILIPWENTQITLQVVGNMAYLPAPVNTGTSILHAANYTFDQSSMSFFNVMSDLSDPTDVSVTIGYGSPVPIPGAVWLLGSGLAGLVGLRRKFKK